MKAVLFDLLSALIDSWSLWDDIAGGREAGRRWRGDYLARTYRAGNYVPYLDLVRASAEAAGLPGAFADELRARWRELAPWPGAGLVLTELARERPLGVVTNCSKVLGRQAAALVDAPFITVVTAEEAGWYKPDGRAYAAGVRGLGADGETLHPDDVLFVAGSPGDIVGASRAGLTVVWHNPTRMSGGGAEEAALHVIHDLQELGAILEEMR